MPSQDISKVSPSILPRPLSDICQALPHAAPFQYESDENYSTYTKAAAVLLEDVRPEICDVGEILSKFSTYRDTYLEKYMTSFVSLSLLELLRPLVLIDIMPVDVLGRNMVISLNAFCINVA